MTVKQKSWYQNLSKLQPTSPVKIVYPHSNASLMSTLKTGLAYLLMRVENEYTLKRKRL